MSSSITLTWSLEQFPLDVYVIFVTAFMGSLYNVLIFRTPKIMEYQWEMALYEKSIEAGGSPRKPEKGKFLSLWGRSFCPSCQKKIPIWFNIPVLGYVLLRGKSSCCKTKISFRYPLIEFVTALVGYLLYLEFGLSMESAMLFFGFSILLLIAYIDYDSYWLPDFLVYPLMFLGLSYSVFSSGIAIEESLYGIFLGYGSLYLIGGVYMKARGIQGMANGDYKLAAALGAWLGPISVPYFCLSAVIFTLIVVVLMKLRKSDSGKKTSYIPFGPGLVVGGLLYWFI